jgi:anti-sigma-K factor RskA
MAVENPDRQDRELRYALYALGLLERAEMAEVRAALEAGDVETAAGVGRALQMTSSFAYVAPDAKPPARLRRRLLLAAGAPERSRHWLWLMGLAAACVLLLVVAFNMRSDIEKRETELQQLQARIELSEALAAPARELYEFLRLPATRSVSFGSPQPARPRGQIFVHPDRGVLLFAANLPEMPAGRIFEMWLIPKDGGAPRPAGLFEARRGEGAHMQRGAVDPAAIAAVAVTLEPAGGSQTPTLPILFVAPLEGEQFTVR